MSRVLVIGYGNELRSDDGVGPRLARTVAGWGLDGVEVVAAHQLLPEMADSLARCEYAVFVDAAAAGAIDVMELAPDPDARLGHVATPAGLLGLARQVYGRAPYAWLVAVPGSDFRLGETLSSATEAAILQALKTIRQVIQSCYSSFSQEGP